MGEEFRGAQLLRIAPYSVPLNHIEEVRSVLKAEMTASSSRGASARGTDPNGAPPHGLRHLEATIDRGVERITPMVCMRAYNHVLALRGMHSASRPRDGRCPRLSSERDMRHASHDRAQFI